MILKFRGKKCMGRHLNPSIYEKMEKTEALLNEGINKDELQSQGGLNYETYNALQRRWETQEQKLMEHKEEIRSFYGSLENAPSNIGPCQKHDPVTGTKNGLVLLTEFKDKKHSHEASEFDNLLFNKDFKQSMRNYYLEASWNQLDIKGKVNDEWYTLSDNRSEYADDVFNLHYPKAQKLVIETIENAKNSGNIDFRPYSIDGKIEILILVFAGSGMDTKLDMNFIRPHQYHLLEPIEVQEGIFVDKYCLVPELPVDDLGCFCHEVGHILGLPDLYKEGYSPIVGSWCLMGIGDHINNGRNPAHPSAWCKLHLGWTEPKSLDQDPQQYDIPAIIDDKVIYKVEVQGSDGKEYFLLENRQQKGFDANLPGSGLLIWHVDENACLKKAPNFDPSHFFLTLKQSDGKEDLEKDRIELIKNSKFGDEIPKEIIGDDGDPFPGKDVNRTFNDKSNPHSRSYKGNISLVEVISISDSAESMKANMGIDLKSRDLLDQDESNLLENDQALKQKLINQFLINFLFSPKKDENSYDQGIKEGMKDFLDKINHKEGLDFYKDGYRRGYDQGYFEGIRFFKKFKKE